MKIKTVVFFILSSLVTVLFTSAGEIKPMQNFKELRQAMIDDNLAAVMDAAEGDFLKEIKKTGGISDDLRHRFLFTKSAYENVFVRQNDPTKAEVLAFFDMHGKEYRMTLSMQLDKSNHRKITSVTVSPNDPLPVLNNFLAVCLSGNTGRYRFYVSDIFLEKHPDIPEGMRDNLDSKIGSGKISGSSASYQIDRSILKGSIKLKKNGVFWKVDEISQNLAAQTPGQMFKKFCRAVQDIKLPQAGTAEPAAEEKDDDKMEDVSDENAKLLAEYILDDFHLKGFLKQITPEGIANMATFKEIFDTRFIKNDIFVSARAETEEKTGMLVCCFKQAADKSWKIAFCFPTEYMYLKTENPASIAEKFFSLWFKENNKEGAIALASEKFKAILDGIKTPGENNEKFTITLENEKIDKINAEVVLTLFNGKKYSSCIMRLTLNNGKWEIDNTDLKEIPAPEKEE